MMECRLCNNAIGNQPAVTLDVPAGTQLFAADADTAQALKTTISIIECPSCSLIQLIGAPVAYEHVSSSSSFVSGQLTEHRLTQLRALLELRAAKPGTGRLLEIGCGDGHLMAHAKGIFDYAIGVEPTQRNAQAAVDQGLDVHQMLMSRDARVPGGPFDYFCSFHVLEHVTDICSVLQGIVRSLKADAVGIVEVPSTESALEHKRFGDFMPDHLNYFTEKTLRMALEWNGFHVERVYRDWGGEHLVAYVRRSLPGRTLSYIDGRQEQIRQLVATVNERQLPFAVWGVSHHLLPCMPSLAQIRMLLAVDGSSSKIGRYIPSTRVRVQSVAALDAIPHGYVAVTAPRFENEILAELSSRYETLVKDEALSAWLGFPVFECRHKKSVDAA